MDVIEIEGMMETFAAIVVAAVVVPVVFLAIILVPVLVAYVLSLRANAGGHLVVSTEETGRQITR
jgi:hypothetical protein